MLALLLLAACSRHAGHDTDTDTGEETAAVEEREPITVPCVEGQPYEGTWGAIVEGTVPVRSGGCDRWQSGCVLTNGYTVEATWHRVSDGVWLDGWDHVRPDQSGEHTLIYVQGSTTDNTDACTITLR